MSKIMTVSINGTEYTLDVGKGWFTEYYEEAAGSTAAPFKGSMAFVMNMVWAGIRCNATVNKLPFTITKEVIAEWAGGLEHEQIKAISDEYAKLNEVGEVLTQAAKA